MAYGDNMNMQRSQAQALRQPQTPMGMANTPGWGPRPEMPGMGGSQNWQEKLAAIQAAAGGTQAPLQGGLPPTGPAMPGTQTLGGTGAAIPDMGGMQSMQIPFDPNGGLQMGQPAGPAPMPPMQQGMQRPGMPPQARAGMGGYGQGGRFGQGGFRR